MVRCNGIIVSDGEARVPILLGGADWGSGPSVDVRSGAAALEAEVTEAGFGRDLGTIGIVGIPGEIRRRNRYSVGRAGDVVETNNFAEMYRGRVTAVLVADAQLDYPRERPRRAR